MIKPEWAYSFWRWTFWAFFHICFRLKVSGQENVPKSGAFILAGNHVSYIDPPLLGAACPRRIKFLARNTLYKGFMGWYLRSIGVVPLEQDDRSLKTIRQSIRILEAGNPVGMFPEGERQHSGEIGHAKRGVGLLAIKAKVPIIPVLIRGTYEALPRGSRRLRFSKIRVAFGPEIPYTTDSQAHPHLETAPSSQRRVRMSHGHDQVLADKVTNQWHRLADKII